MSRKALLVCVLGAVQLACDARGVNLGTEELCVAEPRLTLSDGQLRDPELSTCSRIGDNELTDSGFETPVIGGCQNGLFCQFSAADVDGWDTSSEAQVIEIWHDLHRNVPAPEGSQFVELDAQSQDTIWQDVALSPGQLMYWSFVHRGRNEVETLELLIGPPDAPVSQGTFSSAADAWYPYSGLYRVGETETLTRFALASRTGLAEGNLVDAIIFAPVK
jgi:hypothetical protein